MDEIINKINEIGINEISKKTFISPQFLEAIVNKDFSHFTENRAKKCTHILKRDYNIDMQPWFDEFLNYMRNNNISTSPEIETNLIEDSGQNSSKFFYIIIIILVFIFLGYFGFKKLSQSDIYQKSEPIKTEQIEEKPLAEDIFEANYEPTYEITQEDEQPEVTEEPQEDIKNSFAKIEVSKLWISEYDLDTKKRNENIYSGEYEIKLDRNYVFITGHGSFTLNIDGQKTKLLKSGNATFLVKDGIVEQISLDEYNRLSRGK